MTDRELMQQALDALEQMAKEGWLLHGPEGMDEAQTKCIQSLEALRARLAQPEPEPVKFQIFKPTPPRGAELLYGIHNDKLPWVYDQDPASGNAASMWVTPVYTAPPQREWQGLTDEELSLLWVNYHGDNCLADGRILSYEQAIEAKLKEKNT